MAGRLQDRVALVTGAASGIGRASAAALANEGAAVVVADINAEAGRETVRRIRQTGKQAEFVRADVSKAADVEALIKAAVETYGRLDCAHNNAGVVGGMASLAECTEETWDHTINVNLKGGWLCMTYEIGQMLKQGSGSIVNTASTAGLVGSRRSSVYAAASHGVVGLTRSAALECAEAGVRVNAVCPGMTRTPMIEGIIGGNAQVESQMVGRVPMRRLATPEEVAEAVVWLCSDASSFVTGHTLVIDGGLVAS
jgi:NAD(P)-dependent dehydrogenase (short-subunit alcohol dehydrogenase family)